MNKATFFIGIIISVIVVSGIRLVMNQDDNSSSSTQNTQSQQQAAEVPDEITEIGTFDCLTKSGDGPQTMECASGLKLEDGTQYGLGSDDPSLFAGVPTGTRIEVTGALQEPTNTYYESAGTIMVQSFKQL